MIELNDDIYLFDYNSVYKLINGNITYFNYIDNINETSIININNVLYASQNQIPGILDIHTLIYEQIQLLSLNHFQFQKTTQLNHSL